MNTELLLGKARESIKKLERDKHFVVKDLFEGTEWNDLSRGDKISFGKIFKNEVVSGKYSDVEYVERRKNNSSEYKKI